MKKTSLIFTKENSLKVVLVSVYRILKRLKTLEVK